MACDTPKETTDATQVRIVHSDRLGPQHCDALIAEASVFLEEPNDVVGAFHEGHMRTRTSEQGLQQIVFLEDFGHVGTRQVL